MENGMRYRRVMATRTGGPEVLEVVEEEIPEPASTERSTRLHYLDWLQVLAVLGVFLFHGLHPFDDLVDWHIKNVEKSDLATLYAVFFTPWGISFFFLMAGVTSWFSLRRRTAGRYIRERVTQLLIPFIIGAIVLTPIQSYYEWTHRGWWEGGTIVEFIFSSETRVYFPTEFSQITISPEIFGDLGYHLWFVGFLFSFSLLALPVFMWLKRDSGKRFVATLVRLAERRGGMLAFIFPLMVIRFILSPFYPQYTGWSDFFFMLVCFIYGYILIADERFMRAIRRDWMLYLILAIACALFFLSVAVGVPVLEWMESPDLPGFYLTWAVFSINAWCWTMFMLYIGMRFLDYTNKWLRYFRKASFPVFWVHHAVIFVIAFYVVQWDVDLPIKMLVVVGGAFIASLGFHEFFVRRFDPVRALFGLKPRLGDGSGNENEQ